MFEFLGKLVDAGQYTTVTILFIIVFLIIAGGLFVIYQIFSRSKMKKLKIGNNEVEFGGDKTTNIQAAAMPTSKTDMPTFISTLQQIIDYSVENGNQASLKRQQLYDSQMRYIKDKFDYIKSIIEYEYVDSGLKSSLVVNVLINYCFNVAIIEKLEHICKADKLIERDKSKLIEEHRSLINGAYNSLILELKKYITKSSNDGTLQISFIDEHLFGIVEKSKDSIAEAITDCLQHSWDEANSYFNELKELRRQLSNNVTNTLKSYLSSDQHEMIPTEWYDYDKLPPNEIVGSSL